MYPFLRFIQFTAGQFVHLYNLYSKWYKTLENHNTTWYYITTENKTALSSTNEKEHDSPPGGKENAMKMYSAIVKDGNQVVVIRNQDYRTKAEFINDLRRNGYKVNPKKVKPADVFEYIMEHTNCNPWDWNLTEVPR